MEGHREAHAAGDAQRGEPVRAAAAARARAAASTTMRAPVAPIGWPSAIAPPFTFRRSSGQVELAVAGQHLGREGLVELDQVVVAGREAVALAQARAPPAPDRGP